VLLRYNRKAARDLAKYKSAPFTKIEIKTTVTGIDGFAVKH